MFRTAIKTVLHACYLCLFILIWLDRNPDEARRAGVMNRVDVIA